MRDGNKDIAINEAVEIDVVSLPMRDGNRERLARLRLKKPSC